MEEREQLKMEIRRNQYELQALENREWIEKNQEYANKCFRCKNIYPGKYEYWWLYIRVLGIENFRFVIESFEKDCDGNVSFKTESIRVLSENYEEIETSELNKQRQKILTYIRNGPYWKKVDESRIQMPGV